MRIEKLGLTGLFFALYSVGCINVDEETVEDGGASFEGEAGSNGALPEPDAIVVEPEPDATVVEPEPDATVVEPEPDAAVEPPAAVQFLARYDFEGDFEAEGVVRDLSEAGLNLVVQGVTTAEGLKGSGARFDGQSLLEAALNPLAGRTEVTVSLWFKTNNPENNFKLASAAWWNGGLNASGWNIGTHYPEIWADRQQEFWAPGERENHDNGFVPGE